MALKPQIYKLVCEYRFKSSLLFYDVKNQIGNLLFHDYKHWTTDGLKIRLSNFENRSVLEFDHSRLTLEFDGLNSTEGFRTMFQRALKEYNQKLKIESYLRCGIRTQSMIPVEFKFNELVKITQGKFFSQSPKLLEIVGDRVEDYMYIIITEKDGYKLHITCGPVKKEEISKWYQPATVDTGPGEHPKEIDYPDVAFFIDCDYYINDPKSNIAENFLDHGLNIVTSIPGNIAEYVLGEE